jgi:hypothetical protein
MDKCNKIKNTCGTRIQSECVDYEEIVNTQSSLDVDECINLSETTKDIYEQLEEINDLSELGESCLEYIENENGKLVVKNVLLKFEEEICTLKTEITTLKNTAFMEISLVNSGLDFECLSDSCSESINTVKELMQALISRACA